MTQQTRRGTVKADREFDTTSLREANYGGRVHRDYAAHFFRWGFAARFIKAGMTVLDVGCGVDTPLPRVLSSSLSTVPKSYTGIDLNKCPRKGALNAKWAEYHWETSVFHHVMSSSVSYDLVVCLEVIEHMTKKHGVELLKCLYDLVKPGGTVLLSTPVFDGYKAANHIHEWGIKELQTEIEQAGFTIVNRHGTFMNVREMDKCIKHNMLDLEWIMDKLKEYYSNDVLSCFLAPLFPDHSRNNIWILTK